MPTNYYWQPQFFSPSGIPEVLLFSVISVVVLERVELISYRFLEVPIYCWLVLWQDKFDELQKNALYCKEVHESAI